MLPILNNYFDVDIIHIWYRELWLTSGGGVVFTSMSSTWHPNLKASWFISMCEMRDFNVLNAIDVFISTWSTLTSDEGEAGDRLHLSLHLRPTTRASRYTMVRHDINLLTSVVSQVTPERCICFTDSPTWNNATYKRDCDMISQSVRDNEIKNVSMLHMWYRWP